MKAGKASIALILAALWATHSHAAVTVNCTASASGIAFGIYNPLSAVDNASTGTLQVTCNGTGNGKTPVNLNVALSRGLSGSYATRKMFSGVNSLDYNIFLSTAYNQIFGDGSGGSVAGSVGQFLVAAGGSNMVTETFYGLIPASQDVAPGTYSDVITVTVTY
ncbi:MAG TPA: spore coat U domain-containing protein [Steroidobacteraceae bacterium]|nr:spore coat U domain-containing protein [Steroidobacteraceae bacterium]